MQEWSPQIQNVPKQFFLLFGNVFQIRCLWPEGMQLTKPKYATNYFSCLEEFVKSKFMDLKENQNHHILLFSYLLSFSMFHVNVTNNQKENNECCYSPEVELGGGRVRMSPPIAIFGIQPGQYQSGKKN